MEPFNIILIGRSGSGKGTQAELLMEHFNNFYYLSTGDLFRDLAEHDTDAGKRVKKVLEMGGLPYDDLATTLWMHNLAYNLKEEQGLMADGFPRRLNEAKSLDSFLEFLGRKENTFYVLIGISKEEAFTRLSKRRICADCGRLIPWLEEFKKIEKCDKCGGALKTRSDDTSEAIKGRMDFYNERVTEVIDYYKGQGKLIEINGEQSIEKVFEDILKAIS